MAYVIMYVLTFAIGTILLAVVLEIYNYRPHMGGNYRLVTALSE